MLKRFAIAALIAVATGCAATSPYMKPNASPVGPASADLAQIVFIRPSGFAKGVTITIIDSQGHFIGEATPEGHFAVLVPPGEHTFISWGEGTHSLKANVAAGKTYYVEVSPSMGMWQARFHLKAIKPSTKNWGELGAWLKNTMPHEVLQTQGQAQTVDSRRADADEAIQKGVQRFTEYTPEEANERTLAEADGV